MKLGVTVMDFGGAPVERTRAGLQGMFSTFSSHHHVYIEWSSYRQCSFLNRQLSLLNPAFCRSPKGKAFLNEVCHALFVSRSGVRLMRNFVRKESLDACEACHQEADY